MTRSPISAAIARSCVISSSTNLRSSRISRSRARMRAWVRVSNAERASSASSSRGFIASARAKAIRWRWPPVAGSGTMRPSSSLSVSGAKIWRHTQSPGTPRVLNGSPKLAGMSVTATRNGASSAQARGAMFVPPIARMAAIQSAALARRESRAFFFRRISNRLCAGRAHPCDRIGPQCVCAA